MTSFSDGTKIQLMNAAKTCIEEHNVDNFKLILETTYTETVEKREWGKETVAVLHWQEDINVEIITNVDEVLPYFGYSENKSLLEHALKKNSLEIIDWYLSEGYYLNDKQFKSLCIKNPENSDLMEKICDQYLTLAINSNNVAFTKVVLEHSPHLKNKPELRKRLDVIEPLFSDLGDLKQITENEKKDNNTDSVKTLQAYASTTHGHIKNFLTGRTTGEAFMSSATLHAEALMAKLEEKSEGMAVFKNILLCLTVIGPLIKKLDTGQWLFENSTTSKVRKTTEKFKDMKGSLTLFKEQGKSEPEPNPEHASQPR